MNDELLLQVLVVEDNALNRQMLIRRLSRVGYEVEAVENGQLALEAIELSRPAIVLMDLSMPVLDGWEATRRIRQNTETNDLPVIALTAHTLQSEWERALDAGCNEVMTKPFDFAELVERITFYTSD